MMNNLLPLLAQAGKSFWLPPSASNTAETHDSVFYFILYVTLFFFLLVVALEIYFIIRYRRRSKLDRQDTTAPTHNTPLEIAWTLIPLVIVIVIFFMGFKGFVRLDTPPSNAYRIDVEARMWNFTFKYPNGGVSDTLFVPAGQDVHLVITSADVLHAVYIPAFRISRNAIPRRTTDLWFRATQETGEKDHFWVFCTQYCGSGHSQMVSKLHVLNTGEFNAKLAQLANIFIDPISKEPLPMHKVGESLYKQSGCSQCHTVDGGAGQGPTWKSLWKRGHTFTDGTTLSKDAPDDQYEAYIHQSVLEPGAKVVSGFQNVMPNYASSFSGSPQKDLRLKAITEYIKSLGDLPYTPVLAPTGQVGTPASTPASPAAQ